MSDRPPLLLDTNVIIEAVRAGCWAAIAGALPLETVETCRDEALAGGSHIRGYVRVTAVQLGRVVVRAVEPIGRATFLLHYPEADALDAGERASLNDRFRRGARSSSWREADGELFRGGERAASHG